MKQQELKRNREAKALLMFHKWMSSVRHRVIRVAIQSQVCWGGHQREMYECTVPQVVFIGYHTGVPHCKRSRRQLALSVSPYVLCTV